MLKKQLNILVCLCVFALLISFFLEYFAHMTPCVLCQIQRFLVLAMLFIVMLQRFFYINSKLCFYSFGIVLLLAIMLSCRHVWLQTIPVGSVVINCLPSLDVLWQWMPLHKIIIHMIHGDGLCQSVNWRFLGLSLAMWLAAFYSLLFIYWSWLLNKFYRGLF